MKAAILGVTGFTGAGLLRLLAEHPNIDRVIPVSSSKAGERLTDIDPGLGADYPKAQETNGKMVSADEALRLKPDVVFAALPHLKSAEIAAPFLESSVVIDLSADFRIQDPDLFFRAYRQPPPRPDLLSKAAYGLADWDPAAVLSADLIANPGCYPTCTLLPLLPILSRYTPQGPIVTNALSGISGAGKKADPNLLFCKRSENMNAYLPGKSHRHVTEMEEQLHRVQPSADLFFTPHLVPVRVGMTATTLLSVREPLSDEAIAACFNETYASRPFIHLLTGTLPESANVLDTNRCDIAWKVVGEKTLMLFSAIDNLIKGASGQAVHNMNLRFGFRETAGLKTAAKI